MFYNNVTVNGVSLMVAFVRTTETGLSVNGMTPEGLACAWDFAFADGLNLTVSNDSAIVPQPNEVPVKKERKARKPKAQPEVAEVAQPAVESVEVVDDETYLSLTKGRGRGRPSKDVAAKIAAYKAAHGIE